MAISHSSPLGRENSCTFLRLFFALLVVVGHAFVLGGFGEEPLHRWTGGAMSGREMAVQGFFVLSGFLIATSLGQNPSLWRFACHRAFRILPAFWVYLVLVVFVMAPALIELGWPGRFSYWQSLTAGPRNAWMYFQDNWRLQAQAFDIVPLFAGNPAKFGVNGSLWSVHFEAVFYVCAAVAAAAWQLPRRAAGLAVVLGAVGAYGLGSPVLAFAAVALFWRVIVPKGWGMVALFALLYLVEVLITFRVDVVAAVVPEPARIKFAFHPLWRLSALAFLGGMVWWQFRAHLRWSMRIFLSAVAILAIGALTNHWRLAMPVALPYVVLFLAARLPFQKVERWGDYSYGIYIFSFPIQQLLCFWGVHRLGLLAYVASSVVLSIAVGALSWWLVEKPALRAGRALGAWSPWDKLRVLRKEPAPVAEQMPLSLEEAPQA